MSVRTGGPGPDPRTPTPEQRRGINVQWVNLLMLIPLVGTLVPEFFNARTPAIGGMPFFYWYQLVWIPVSVTLTWVVYRSTRTER